MKGCWKVTRKFPASIYEFWSAKRVQNVEKMNQIKWDQGGLNLWPHHVKNHENKEVKRNVVKGIRTMVLAGKCNLKEKKEAMRGVGFKPTTSKSDLRRYLKEK